jgi:hypothetical protein
MEPNKQRFQVIESKANGTFYIVDTLYNRHVDPLPFSQREHAEIACAEGNRQYEESGNIPYTWTLASIIDGLNSNLNMVQL